MTDQWDAGRLDSDLEGVGFDTLAVRAGQHRTPEGEHSEALFLTSSYVFRTAADAAARFAGEVPGNVYSRYTNPTVRAFEERLAALEGAEQAVATSTGMAAILAVVMSLCSAGDHVLVSRSVFGSTISLFEKYFKRFGVVDYVPLVDLPAGSGHQGQHQAAVRRVAVQPAGRAGGYHRAGRNRPCQRRHAGGGQLLLHPGVAAAAEAGCRHRVPLGDQVHRRPGPLHGRRGGRSQRADERSGRLPAHRRADPQPVQRLDLPQGPGNPAPAHAAHCAKRPALAEWLEQQDGVEKVHYAGLRAIRSTNWPSVSGFGAVVSFEVKGGKEGAWRFIDATRVISITTNLGDSKTTITHPATTSHGRLAPQEREAAGIRDSLIRVAVGLEDVADLQADLARGLAAL
jgi:O-succinylhomoserine sulfhydrylase